MHITAMNWLHGLRVCPPAWVLLTALVLVSASARAATPARHAPSPGRTAADSTLSRRPASPPAARRSEAKPRTLESIQIEGEIAVPQVLFITARDLRRFRDGTGASYLKSSRDVAGSMTGPTRLRLVTTTDALKEETR